MVDYDVPSEKRLMELQDELDYLRHFYQEADFGPAHEEVVDLINSSYGEDIPQGYNL